MKKNNQPGDFQNAGKTIGKQEPPDKPGPPVKPEKDIPVKPDTNPDPTKPRPGVNEPGKIDPTRIEEPGKVDPTRIDQPGPPKKDGTKN